LTRLSGDENFIEIRWKLEIIEIRNPGKCDNFWIKDGHDDEGTGTMFLLSSREEERGAIQKNTQHSQKKMLSKSTPTACKYAQQTQRIER
jgi:hypothetical protein